MDLKPICHPSPPKKMKCSFLDYVQLLIICRAGRWTQTPSTAPLQPKKWNVHFLDYTQLHNLLGWSMDSNPIHCPSPAKKMMIGQAEWWTQTPSTIPLQPIKWNAHFWILFNFWWSARLVNGLKPHLPPLSSQKMKSSFFYYVHFWWSAWLID